MRSRYLGRRDNRPATRERVKQPRQHHEHETPKPSYPQPKPEPKP